jgi:hypothetical protein
MYLREISRANVGARLPSAGDLPYLAGGEMPDVTRPYLGVDQRDLTVVAYIDTDNFDLDVVFGQFEAEAVTSAIGSCGECVEYETRTYAGITYFHWELGIRRTELPPFYGYFPRQANLLVTDGMIVISRFEEAVHGVIESVNGSTEWPAAVRPHLNLLKTLEARGVLGAMFSTEDFSVDNVLSTYGSLGDPRAKVATTPLLVPFVAVASGVGIENGQQVHQLAIMHETAEGAALNQERLVHRIKEGLNEDGHAWSEHYDRVKTELSGAILFVMAYPAVGDPVIVKTTRPNHHPVLLVHE